MQGAIQTCHAIDECKEIADRAVAIAAYYKQIKDDTSVRQFLQIKIRAWRRIGQLMQQVDKSGCNTMRDYYERIREIVDLPVVYDMSDAAISEAIRLAKLPDDFFEENVGDFKGVSDLLRVYAEIERESSGKPVPADWHKHKKDREHQQQERADADAMSLKTWSAHDDAVKEVGITMDRRDRLEMQHVVLLIQRTIHDVLRQAAFDRHMTMQAVLREGLNMWFEANGYRV